MYNTCKESTLETHLTFVELQSILAFRNIEGKMILKGAKGDWARLAFNSIKNVQ